MTAPTTNWTEFKIEDHGNLGVLFHNNHYHVFVRKTRNPKPDGPDIIHLSIRDNQRTAKHDWRDLQRIKNEILGPEFELVELYPRESQLVDLSNQFHLFGFLTEEPLFTRMGLGWEQGRVIWDGISPKPHVPGHDVSNAVQRPIEK
jgi:hypothetical protein